MKSIKHDKANIATSRVIFNAVALGRAVRAERRALGKTQAELAREADCRRQTIGDLEAGRNVSVQTLMTVLGSLGKRLTLIDARPSMDDMHLLLDPDDED